jgi:hypothetical protein
MSMVDEVWSEPLRESEETESEGGEGIGESATWLSCEDTPKDIPRFSFLFALSRWRCVFSIPTGFGVWTK